MSPQSQVLILIVKDSLSDKLPYKVFKVEGDVSPNDYQKLARVYSKKLPVFTAVGSLNMQDWEDANRAASRIRSDYVQNFIPASIAAIEVGHFPEVYPLSHTGERLLNI